MALPSPMLPLAPRTTSTSRSAMMSCSERWNGWCSIRLTDGTPSSASILLRGASSLTVVCERASLRSVGSDSPKNTDVKASSPCVSHSSATRRRIVSSCGSSSR